MYLAFLTTAFQARLAYRGQVWASVFGELVEVFAKIAIWMSVYAVAGTSAGGVTLKEMITYAILGGLVTTGVWEWRRYVNEVGYQIKTGDVAVFLLKPLSYPLMLLSAELGKVLFRILAVIAPVSVIAGLVYGIAPPADLFHGTMAALFFVLGFLMLFVLATIAGLLAFWLMTVFSLEWLLQALISILAGTFVPLWFFPAPAAAVIEKLPFAYTAYHPMAVYLGKIDATATLVTFAIGVAWLLLLGAFAGWLWSRARERIVVQGG
jgi:ABC-2 type transport system permease protein